MKLKYVVVFERVPSNYCAYLPDLPGCISTGKTWEEIQQNIREALAAHVETMLEYGDPLPEKAMSLEEAMAHHSAPVPDDAMDSFSRYGEGVDALSTTFEMVEVDVHPSPPARSG